MVGVLQEYSIINNILLYDIQIGGVDCTMHSHGTIVGVITMLMGGA